MKRLNGKKTMTRFLVLCILSAVLVPLQSGAVYSAESSVSVLPNSKTNHGGSIDFDSTDFGNIFDSQYANGVAFAYSAEEQIAFSKDESDTSNNTMTYSLVNNGATSDQTHGLIQFDEIITDGKLEIEFDYYQTAYRLYVGLLHNGGNYWTRRYNVVHSKGTDGTISYTAKAQSWSSGTVSGSSDALQLNAWQHVKAVVDVDAKTYTYTINGKEYQTTYDDYQTFSGFTGIVIGRGNTKDVQEDGVVKLDNISVKKLVEPLRVTTSDALVEMDDSVSIAFNNALTEEVIASITVKNVMAEDVTEQFAAVLSPDKKSIVLKTAGNDRLHFLGRTCKYIVTVAKGTTDIYGTQLADDFKKPFIIGDESRNYVFYEDFDSAVMETNDSGNKLAGYLNGAVAADSQGNPKMELHDGDAYPQDKVLKITNRSVAQMHRHALEKSINSGKFGISFDFYANQGDVAVALYQAASNWRVYHMPFYTNHSNAAVPGGIYYSKTPNDWPVKEDYCIGLEPQLVEKWQHIDIVVDLDHNTYSYIRTIDGRVDEMLTKSFDYTSGTEWNGTVGAIGFGVPSAISTDTYNTAVTMFDNIAVYEIDDTQINISSVQIAANEITVGFDKALAEETMLDNLSFAVSGGSAGISAVTLNEDRTAATIVLDQFELSTTYYITPHIDGVFENTCMITTASEGDLTASVVISDDRKSAEATILNTSNSTGSIYLILAAYVDSTLVDVNVQQVSLQGGINRAATAFEIAPADGANVKAFVWNQKLIPLPEE